MIRVSFGEARPPQWEGTHDVAVLRAPWLVWARMSDWQWLHAHSTHDVSPQTDVLHKRSSTLQLRQAAFATSRKPCCRRFGARHTWCHADANAQRVSVLSFFVSAKIKIDLKYVLLNLVSGLSFLMGICVYKGSFLCGLEISCQYSFNILVSP